MESVGKKLHDARVQRGLSLEEAAHATKLRQEQILALEGDDYARFGSNAYAKGFLQIYGRFLGVEVADFARTLSSANRISVSDYQYLSNGVARRESDDSATFSFLPKREVPSIVPLIAFALLLVLGFVGYDVYRNWLRVTGAATAGSGRAVTEEPAAMTPFDASAPPPAPVSNPAPLPTAPAEQARIAPEPVATGPVTNEVLVEPIKKTWITVRRDDPQSAPVFEDFLYPDARPLKVKGARIYIEAKDPSAIVIRKNGAPIAYAPGAEIR